MNILLITEDHSLANFGITTLVSQLSDELVKYCDNYNIVIFSTSHDVVQQDEKVIIEKVPPTGLYRTWKGSADLLYRLKKVIEKYQIDVIHIHGVWMAAQWAGLSVARSNNIPLVLSVHGMFQPWLWHGQGAAKQIKKKLYFSLFLKPAIPQHVIFHALSQKEAITLEHFFPGKPKVIIPNAIALDSSVKKVNQSIEKKFLFLGRVHPIKAVDLLVQAFYNANLGEDWLLNIVGPDDAPEYSEKIKMRIESLGLLDRVKLLGPLYGENKQKYFTDSWALVLPSFSEGFPMVSLEAAQYGLPTILTTEAGLENWTASGGLVVKPEIDDLKSKLVQASQWNLIERIDRGERSREYIKENYSWDVVIPKWNELYMKAYGKK